MTFLDEFVSGYVACRLAKEGAMTIEESKRIVHEKHPDAVAIRELHNTVAWYSIRYGGQHQLLSAGWLTEKGAWNAAAEVVKPGCTGRTMTMKEFEKFRRTPKEKRA